MPHTCSDSEAVSGLERGQPISYTFGLRDGDDAEGVQRLAPEDPGFLQVMHAVSRLRHASQGLTLLVNVLGFQGNPQYTLVTLQRFCVATASAQRVRRPLFGDRLGSKITDIPGYRRCLLMVNERGIESFMELVGLSDIIKRPRLVQDIARFPERFEGGSILRDGLFIPSTRLRDMPHVKPQDCDILPRAHVSVVLDWTTLTGGCGRADGEFTGPIHRRDIARLLCDCSVSRIVTGPDSLPLDVGRTRRTVPPALRRALVARDGGCRFPGCDRPPGWCDAHHTVPWMEGGCTTRDGLILLCDRHHHVVHQPGWSLDFDGTHLVIRRPGGTVVA